MGAYATDLGTCQMAELCRLADHALLSLGECLPFLVHKLHSEFNVAIRWGITV